MKIFKLNFRKRIIKIFIFGAKIEFVKSHKIWKNNCFFVREFPTRNSDKIFLSEKYGLFNIEKSWYCMFFHCQMVLTAVNIIFWHSRNNVSIQMFCEKEKNENSREKNIELPIYIYNRKQTYKNTKTNICIEFNLHKSWFTHPFPSFDFKIVQSVVQSRWMGPMISGLWP